MKIWDDLSRQKVLPTPVSIDVFLRDLFFFFRFTFTSQFMVEIFRFREKQSILSKLQVNFVRNTLMIFSIILQQNFLKLLIFTSKIKLNFSLFKIDYFSKNFETFSSHYKQKSTSHKHSFPWFVKIITFLKGANRTIRRLKKG